MKKALLNSIYGMKLTKPDFVWCVKFIFELTDMYFKYCKNPLLNISCLSVIVENKIRTWETIGLLKWYDVPKISKFYVEYKLVKVGEFLEKVYND